MEGNILENILKIKNMDMGVLNGEMEGFILVNGRMGNNMEMEYSLTKQEEAEKEFGKKVKKLSEIMKES